jgi:outer membrane protein assembly factor BamB
MFRPRISLSLLTIAGLFTGLGLGAGPSSAAVTTAGNVVRGTLAAKGLVPGDWPGFRNRQDKGAFNQAESVLTQATVGSLHVVNAIPLGSFIDRGQAGGTGHGLFYTRIDDSSEGMAAYDQTTGVLRWRSHPGGNELVVGDDAVYSISQEEQFGPLGNISAHDPMTGAVLWQIPLQRLIEISPPVLAGSTLVVSYTGARRHGYTQHIRALNADTGRQLWQRQFRVFGGVSGPSVNSGTVLVSVNGTLTALDLRNGTTAWSLSLPLKSAPLNPPIVSNGVVYVVETGQVLALTARTGTQQWASPALETSPFEPMALADGRIYVPLSPAGASGPDIVALDAASGAIQWSERLGSGTGDAVVAGNVLYVYVGPSHDVLESLNPVTGQPLSSLTFPPGADTASEPMVSHGHMYIADNELHAIQVFAP